MVHGSLFSGIGGFDLAAHWAGWKNAFHCDNNPFVSEILKYYWPNAISYDNIKTTDFSIWRGRIDVLSGGFPCQPFSTAGKRGGKDDHRYLWPEMLRAIREIRPPWVCGENVDGLTSMVQPEVEKTDVESKETIGDEDNEEIISEYQRYVVETICKDLEQIGYEVQPLIIPACATGAPHRRDRIWFIAYSDSARTGMEKHRNSGQEWSETENDKSTILSERYGKSCAEGTTEPIMDGNVTNTSNKRPARNSRKKSELTEASRHFCKRDASDTEIPNDRGSIGETSTGQKCEFGGGDIPDDVADSNSPGRRQRHAAYFTEEQRFGSRPGDEDRENWENFPTQSPVCNGNDGLSSLLDPAAVFAGVNAKRGAKPWGRWRNKSIEGGGNAVVPQIPFEIFTVINEYEQNA